MAPQIIILVLLIFGLSHEMIKHGQPKEGRYDAGIYFIGTLITLGLYWWAGLFDVFIR